MQIPKTLKVGGIKYKILKKKRLEKKDSKYSAVAKHSQAEICIALYAETGPFSNQKIEECFFHELLHCVDAIYNNNKLNEDTVDRLSQGLYQVLKDNKMFR